MQIIKSFTVTRSLDGVYLVRGEKYVEFYATKTHRKLLTIDKEKLLKLLGQLNLVKTKK